MLTVGNVTVRVTVPPTVTFLAAGEAGVDPSAFLKTAEIVALPVLAAPSGLST